MSDAVLYELRGPAAWITLNRPEKMNAINGDVLEGLNSALQPSPKLPVCHPPIPTSQLTNGTTFWPPTSMPR